MWQLNHKYTFTAFAEFEPDYFVQLPYQTSDRMAVIMKETNFDYSNYYGLQASAQFHVGQWLNGTVNATGLYRHDKSSNFFDLPFDRTRLSAILGGTAVAKLSQRHSIQFILNPFFQSKAIQGVYDISPLFYLNASLRWTSDNGKWSVIAKANNIFQSQQHLQLLRQHPFHRRQPGLRHACLDELRQCLTHRNLPHRQFQGKEEEGSGHLSNGILVYQNETTKICIGSTHSLHVNSSVCPSRRPRRFSNKKRNAAVAF